MCRVTVARMRKVIRVAFEWVSLVMIMLASPLLVTAVGSPTLAPQLIISQFKITSSNGQFVTIYNQTDQSLDLSDFELDYTSQSSGKTSTLPLSGTLPAHNYYLLADDVIHLCYQTVVNATSLGLATNGGLQLWHVTKDADSRVMTLEDGVSWVSKNGNPTTSPLTLSSSANVSFARQVALGTDTIITAPGAGSWAGVVPDPNDPCQQDVLVSSGGSGTVQTPSNQLRSGAQPPATIVSVDDAEATSGDSPVLPPHDVGLAAPVVNELVPNPSGTGNDSTDEFIELYNSNTVSFDLSGFVLQTGTTTKHKYTFPADTLLAPQSFHAFYSADTGLSLSNSGSQAALLDPFGNVVSQSDAYGTAKDGVAWALAKGSWYFTDVPTPNAANVIKQAASGSKSSSPSSKSSSVKGASTTAGNTNSGGNASAPTAAVTPIHPWTLAVVAGLAVAYGVYEYRLDLQNRFYEFRKHRTARRGGGYALKGR